MRHLVALIALFAAFLPAAIADVAGRDVGPILDELRCRADSGDGEALYHLSALYERGYDTIPSDSVMAVRLLKQSASAGYAPAQNYLGYRLYEGQGMPRDVDSALFWIERAAEQGDLKAASNLGYLLVEGNALVRDYAHGAYWLKKAAEAGLPVAMSQLGDLYATGRGVECDTLEAARLYERSAASGLRDAEWKLISMMENRWKVLPPDSAAALGRKYYLGGLPKSGVMLMEMSPASDAESEYLLGDAYGKAYGVAYNHAVSQQHFLKAAIMGHREARRVVAELLEIFPDLFADESLERILREAGLRVDEVSDPQYWLHSASDPPVSL